MIITTAGSRADDAVPVAGNESPDLPDETNDIQPSLAARRAAAREHLTQLDDEQRYEEAAAVALQILRLTQEEYGEDAQQVIDPLIALAETQRNDTKTAAAEQNLSAAIMLIERYAGPLSIDLIEPLTALGEIYNESRLYEEATQAFDRALRLNHINLGFTNFDQFPIMDGLTDSHSSQSDFEEATFYQESQLEIQQRRLGIDNPETAHAYYKLARWYTRVNRYEDAKMAYHKANRVVSKALGKDSIERVEGLQGLALVYQQIDDRSSANSTLRKALQLIEDSPENDPLRRAAVLVSLGDSLAREGRFKTAKEQYAAAWQALPDDEAGADRREYYFGRPVRLEGNLFPKYARRARGRPPEELRTGSVLIDYTIDTRGRVTDSSIVESHPPELMDRSFLRIYRQSLYRPRYVDGVAEFSDALLARHEFLYIADTTETEDLSDDPSEDNPDAIAKPDQSRGKLSYPGAD